MILIFIMFLAFKELTGYTFVEDICKSRSVPAGRSGTIQSPNYPKNYTNNINCSLTLTNLTKGDFLLVQFSPDSYVHTLSDSGYSDYLTFPDFNGGYMCGNLSNVQRNITVTSTSIRLTFITNGQFTSRGFLLHYTVLPRSLTQTIGNSTNDTEYIVGPLFPQKNTDATSKGRYTSLLEPQTLLCVLLWSFYVAETCDSKLSNNLTIGEQYFCKSQQGQCVHTQHKPSNLSVELKYLVGNYDNQFIVEKQGSYDKVFYINNTEASHDVSGQGILLSPGYPFGFWSGSAESDSNIMLSVHGAKLIIINLENFHVTYYGEEPVARFLGNLTINGLDFVRYKSSSARSDNLNIVATESSPVHMTFNRSSGSRFWNPRFTIKYTVSGCSYPNITGADISQTHPENATVSCLGGLLVGCQESSQTIICNLTTGEWVFLPTCAPCNKEDGRSTTLSVEKISGTPLSVEEISGIVLGITGFVLLITIIVVILLRRSAQKRKRAAERGTTGETTALNSSADDKRYENTDVTDESSSHYYASEPPSDEYADCGNGSTAHRLDKELTAPYAVCHNADGSGTNGYQPIVMVDSEIYSG